jgi:pimeloyl-ACP methyl ester carboxylesterase
MVSFFRSGYVALFSLLIIGCTAHTPEIKDTNGKKVPKSIASIERVKIGGIDQTIILRSEDTTKPILLFVHGGPGMPEGGMLRKYLFQLESMFIVVDWEQRGAGLTGVDNSPDSSMTIEQLSNEVVDLTKHLLTRFNRDKLFIFGHSFGTVISTLAIQNNPELFAAYIGAGQIINQIRAEKDGYRFCSRNALKLKNEKAIKELKEISFPKDGNYTSTKYPTVFKSIAIQRKWLAAFGGITMNPDNLKPMMKICIFNKEHSLLKSLKFMKRFETTTNLLGPQVISFNAIKQIPELKVPVYFITGVYDKITPAHLVDEYVNQLKAPRKVHFQFQNSGHLAPFEEQAKFCAVVHESVLKECKELNLCEAKQ